MNLSFFMQNEANFGWSRPGHRGAGRAGSLHAEKKDVKDVNGHPMFPGCQTVGDPIRSNLAAGYADCVRLVEWPDKAGWQKLDGSQRGRVHPGLIRQDPVLVRPSSGERPWPPCFLGCRKAAGPCHSQSRLASRMVVKRYGMGSKCVSSVRSCPEQENHQMASVWGRLFAKKRPFLAVSCGPPKC